MYYGISGHSETWCFGIACAGRSAREKLTAARAKLAKIEGEIEKLIDTLTGANPLLLQYAQLLFSMRCLHLMYVTPFAAFRLAKAYPQHPHLIFPLKNWTRNAKSS